MSETTNIRSFRDEAIILLNEYEEIASKNTADALTYLKDKKDNRGFSKAELKSVYKISERIWSSLSSKIPPSIDSRVTRQKCTSHSKRYVRNFLSTLAENSVMKSSINDLFQCTAAFFLYRLLLSVSSDKFPVTENVFIVN